MISLEQRILAALGSDGQTSPWEQLIALFQADREAFYLLVNEDMAEGTVSKFRELADLAAQVAIAVRESYHIATTHGGATLESFSGRKTFIPSGLVDRVAHFLREIDGKST